MGVGQLELDRREVAAQAFPNACLESACRMASSARDQSAGGGRGPKGRSSGKRVGRASSRTLRAAGLALVRSTTGRWGRQGASSSTCSPAAIWAKQALTTKKSMADPAPWTQVLTGGRSTTPPARWMEPLSASSPGLMLKSPAQTQGPAIPARKWSTSLTIETLAPE